MTGIAVLAVGALAAVALTSSGNSKKEVTTVARTVTESQPATGAEGDRQADSSAAAPTLEPFSGNLYVAEVPSGWIPETIEEEISGRYESQWRNPDEENTSVLIDSQPHPSNTTPVEDAESVRAQTSKSEGYREVAFEETGLQGFPAARWVFEVEGDRRVDYFVISCGVGFAILGSASPSIFGAWAPTFHKIANSVTPYCE